jgi:hypothetical protein
MARTVGLRAAPLGQTTILATLDASTTHLLAASIQGDTVVTASLSGATDIAYIQIGGVLLDNNVMATSRASLDSLEAAQPASAVMVSMAGRAPVYVGSQSLRADITVGLLFRQPTYAARRVTYESLVASIEAIDDLVLVEWTVGDGVLKSYYAVVTSIRPDAWFHRATILATVPDAVPDEVAA